MNKLPAPLSQASRSGPSSPNSAYALIRSSSPPSQKRLTIPVRPLRCVDDLYAASMGLVVARPRARLMALTSTGCIRSRLLRTGVRSTSWSAWSMRRSESLENPLQTETIEILRAQVEQLDGHLKTKDDQIEKLEETLRDHTKLLEQTSKPGLWKRIFE